MKEIGEYLKETRIKNGVSIEEVSEDLDMTYTQLENIEEGNIRAFKDIYALKEYIKVYSKYLGLDPEKLLDEFNDFLFEHTSKISLDDIIAAKNISKETENKKVLSPYTIEKKKKIKVKPILIVILILVIAILISYVIIICVNNKEKVNTELSSSNKIMEEYYEFTK